MSPKGRNQKRLKVLRCDVLRADLNDARALSVCGRKQCAKPEVVSEDNMTSGIRPRHDLRIGGPWVADGRPMDRFPTVALQNRYPLRGEVHIDNQLHGTDNGISISSARHAAYDNASRMSSASR